MWDIEDVANNKDWSIVKIHDDITTNLSHTNLALYIDPDKTLTVTGDNSITNTWYLQLDGTLDLADDSQLIQTENSDLVTSATGKILRRQDIMFEDKDQALRDDVRTMGTMVGDLIREQNGDEHTNGRNQQDRHPDHDTEDIAE